MNKIIVIGLLILSGLGFEAEYNKRTKYLNKFPILVENTSGKNLYLYLSAQPNAQAVGVLNAGHTYQFLYPGNQGDWLHGEKNGQKIFTKTTKRKKIIDFSYFTLSLNLLGNIFYISLSLTLLLTLLSKFGKKQKKHSESINYSKQLNEKENEIRQLRDKVISLTQSQQKNVEEFTLIKERFDKKAEDDETRYNININKIQKEFDELEFTYHQLQNKYQKIIDDGISLDIPFDDKEYEGFLKGRKFELFFAKHLMQDRKFEILEWTPDKGMLNNIYVKSNANPDFVFQYDKKFNVAIECKYRSGLVKDKNQRKVTWANIDQYKRYLSFKEKRDMNVYIALGVEGEAESPKYCYLANLLEIKELSSITKFINQKPQYSTTLKELFNYYILRDKSRAERIILADVEEKA